MGLQGAPISVLPNNKHNGKACKAHRDLMCQRPRHSAAVCNQSEFLKQEVKTQERGCDEMRSMTLLDPGRFLGPILAEDAVQCSVRWGRPRGSGLLQR